MEGARDRPLTEREFAWAQAALWPKYRLLPTWDDPEPVLKDGKWTVVTNYRLARSEDVVHPPSDDD